MSALEDRLALRRQKDAQRARRALIRHVARQHRRQTGCSRALSRAMATEAVDMMTAHREEARHG